MFTRFALALIAAALLFTQPVVSRADSASSAAPTAGSIAGFTLGGLVTAAVGASFAGAALLGNEIGLQFALGLSGTALGVGMMAYGAFLIYKYMSAPAAITSARGNNTPRNGITIPGAGSPAMQPAGFGTRH